MRRVYTWFAIIALVTIGACGSGKSKEKEPGASAAADADKDRDEPSSNPFGNLDFLGSMLSRQLDEPGPYDEPRKSEDHDEDKDHYVVLELEGTIQEIESFSLFSTEKSLELLAIQDKLVELASREHVKGLLVRAGELGMDMATAEELRAALIRFKGEGKRALACHVEDVSNMTYYMLSACDSIAIAPLGGIVISGATAMSIHVRGLLDKLGVQPDFVHLGAYKGAGEIFMRDAPSNELRETLEALVKQAYETMVTGIAEGRKLDRAKAEALIDRALFPASAALDAGLVDRVAVFEVYRDEVRKDLPWTAIKLGKSDKPDLGELMRFVGLVPRTRPSGPHVALVYAVGSVVDGKGGGIVGARQEIASRTLASAFRVLAQDDDVKAVVLRIDSGGGSALASEIIWNAVAEARARKPVIVSMGDVAASGGYYIACGASKIYALDNTITGSIGVVGGKLALRKALDSIGVKVHPVGRGKHAFMTSAMDVWTPDERKALMDYMEAVYRTFVEHVAQGRGKSYDQIHAIAQGRVWTGRDAMARGLVDEIGGLHAALGEARKQGGVDADVALEVYPPEPTLIDLLSSFGEVQARAGLDAAVVGSLRDVARDLGVAEARAVATLLEQVLLLRDTRVLAATWLPVVIR